MDGTGWGNWLYKQRYGVGMEAWRLGHLHVYAVLCAFLYVRVHAAVTVGRCSTVVRSRCVRVAVEGPVRRGKIVPVSRCQGGKALCPGVSCQLLQPMSIRPDVPYAVACGCMRVAANPSPYSTPLSGRVRVAASLVAAQLRTHWEQDAERKWHEVVRSGVATS